MTTRQTPDAVREAVNSEWVEMLRRSAAKLAPVCAKLADETPVAGEPDPLWWERQSAIREASVILGHLAALDSRVGDAGEGWQSIETAPRDGTWFIADGGGLDRPTPMKWCERVGAWEADAVMLEDWDNQAEGYCRPLFWFAIPDRLATPAPAVDAQEGDDEGPCTDCGDTGITIQTERACSCEAGDQYRGPAVDAVPAGEVGADDLEVCPSCGALPVDWTDNPFGEAAINEAVERMRADPFGDDAHLLGTTQQDDRMRHYARAALSHGEGRK